MTIQRVNFVSIPVSDQDRAIAFYCDLLGLKVQTDTPYEDGWRWIFLEIPGADTLIQFAKSGDIATSKERPALVLISDDVDRDTAKLKDANTLILDGPADAPWHEGVRYSLIEDSEGNTVLLQSSLNEGA